MADDLPPEVIADLRRDFGYAPDEAAGEKWCVYQGHSLIVVHPEQRPRIYAKGCGGVPYEFDIWPCLWP